MMKVKRSSLPFTPNIFENNIHPKAFVPLSQKLWNKNTIAYDKRSDNKIAKSSSSKQLHRIKTSVRTRRYFDSRRQQEDQYKRNRQRRIKAENTVTKSICGNTAYKLFKPCKIAKNASIDATIPSKRLETSSISKRRQHSINFPSHSRSQTEKCCTEKASCSSNVKHIKNTHVMNKPKSILLCRDGSLTNTCKELPSGLVKSNVIEGLNILIRSEIPSPKITEEQWASFKSLEAQAIAYKTVISDYMESKKAFR